MSVTESTPHVFQSAYYARLSELERVHWWGLGMRAIATRMLDRIASPERRWRVFDAGCGTGLSLSWLGRYTTVSPVGLDYAADALTYCARSGHARLVQGTATALPITSGRFDVVISMDVMQHLPRPGGDAAMLAEIARILQPGGRFFLRTNSRCGYDATHADDYHRYTVDEVRTLLTNAGLEIEQATYTNFIPGLLATWRRRLSRPVHQDGDPGLYMVPRPPESSPVVRLLYWLLLAEATWVGRWGLSLPFGHSIMALARKPGEADVAASAGTTATSTGPGR